MDNTESTPVPYWTNFLIPIEAFACPLLSPAEKNIYASLRSMNGSTNKGCWASNEYIADFHQITIKTVKNALTNLETLGFIKRKTIKRQLENGAIREDLKKYRSVRTIYMEDTVIWKVLGDLWNESFPQRNAESHTLFSKVVGFLKKAEDIEIQEIKEYVGLTWEVLKKSSQSPQKFPLPVLKTSSSKSLKSTLLLIEYIKRVYYENITTSETSSLRDCSGTTSDKIVSPSGRKRKPPRENETGIPPRKSKSDASKVEDIHRDFAKQLYAIIETKDKLIPKTAAASCIKDSGWPVSFYRMQHADGYPVELIQQALDWYKVHVHDMFTPVAESGLAFREKFPKIQNAMSPNKKHIPGVSLNKGRKYLSGKGKDKADRRQAGPQINPNDI